MTSPSKYSAVLSLEVAATIKLLRLELTHQNISEAIQVVLWDIPSITKKLFIIENRGELPDKIHCTVYRNNLFNNIRPFITPEPIEFGPDKLSFQAKDGINPSGELASWLLENMDLPVSPSVTPTK